MTNLRQRHVNLANGDGKSDPPVDGANCTVAPKPSARLSYRVCIFLASVALSSALFLLSSKQQQVLPESYVLCSRAGNRIYTVDDAGSQVQCLTVHKSQIVATGSLGEGFLTKFCVAKLTGSPDEVKEHWNDHVFNVQTADSSGNTSRPPLLVRYIDRGSIVVPGMSGMSVLKFNIFELCRSLFQILTPIFLNMAPDEWWTSKVQRRYKVRRYRVKYDDQITDSIQAVSPLLGSSYYRIQMWKMIRRSILRLVTCFITNIGVFQLFWQGWGWDHTSWPVEEWPTAVCNLQPITNSHPDFYMCLGWFWERSNCSGTSSCPAEQRWSCTMGIIFCHPIYVASPRSGCGWDHCPQCGKPTNWWAHSLCYWFFRLRMVY